MKNKIISIIIASIMLVGCFGGSDKIEQKVETSTYKALSPEQYFLQTEYTFKDLPLALREPDKYIGKKFGFSGDILDSRTSEEMQVVTIKLDSIESFTEEYYMDTDDYDVVSVEYNIEMFGNQRLLKGEPMSFVGTLDGIKSHSEYGDVLSFTATAIMSTHYYLGLVSLEHYFDSMGIDAKTLDLQVVPYNNEGEFDNQFGTGAFQEFQNTHFTQPVVTFKTSSGIYWAIAISYFDYNSDIILYSAKAEDGKQVVFEEKQAIDLSEVFSERFW